MSGIRTSIIIATYNEERYIERCLDSLLAQSFPQDEMEILVVDGGSDDATWRILERYAKAHPTIRLFENPKRIPAAAANIGIAHARGEFVFTAGAHAEYDREYVATCIGLLEITPAKHVGSVQRPVGEDYVGEAIALAQSTPFGVGDAVFRYARHDAYVDTVFGGVWRRSTLDQLGGFNEDWVVNEDYEINYRLRQAGGQILVSPQAPVRYFVRTSLARLVRQYYRYGMWRVKTMVAHPKSCQWRHLPPPVLVLALAASLLVFPSHRMLGTIIPFAYIAAALSSSAATAARHGWRYFPLLPLAYMAMHLGWGVGFLAGCFRFGIPRIGFKRSLRGTDAL
jgi:glycosyltransferase involved in cell wall biosynthesis